MEKMEDESGTHDQNDVHLSVTNFSLSSYPIPSSEETSDHHVIIGTIIITVNIQEQHV